MSELVATVVAALEVDAAFDVGAFLERHPEHAAEVRERLQRLTLSGILGAAVAPLEGRIIARRYRVLGELGRGGMGVVLRAMDLALEREVALKLVTPGEIARPEVVARFRRETRIHAMLEHPNIVTAYDAGESSQDGVYLAMRKVEGETLRAVIGALEAGDARVSGEYSLRRRVDVVLRVCDALSFAHDRGVVHRDLKPANVMIGRFGEVYLMDWGLAKASGPEAAPLLAGLESPGSAPDPSRSPERTLDGYLFGTPSYMSPEQARSDASAIGPATDVFGTGAVLYHALSGRPPYWGKTMTEVVVRAARADLNDPTMARARRPVPRELVAVCRMAMEPDPERRYGSIRELAQDLEAFLEARGGRAWRDGPVDRLAKLVRRRPVAAMAVFALGLVGAAATVAVEQASEARAEGNKRLLVETERDDEAQRGRMARLAAELRVAMRDAPALVRSDQLSDHEAIIDLYDGILTKYGVAIGGEQPVEQMAELLTGPRRIEPASRDAILDALYRLEVSLYMEDYAWAAELALGRMPREPRGATAERLRMVTQERRDRLTLWERTRRLVEAAETDPACAETWRNFIGFVQRGPPAAMVEHFTRLLDERSSERGLTLAALFCERMHSDVEASPLWKRFAEQRPDVFEPHALLCYSAARRNFPSADGARFGEQAKLLSPEALWVWISLANCHGQLGQFDRAVENAKRAVELDGEHALAQQILGWALQLRARETDPSGPEGREDLDAAAVALRRSIDLEPRSPSSYEVLCAVELQRGNLEVALQVLDEGARACPQDRVRLLLQKVAHAGRAGALDDAWAICLDFPDGSLEQAVSYCQFAMGLLGEGRVEHATAVLERGAAMRKALPEKWTTLEPEDELVDMRRRLELVTGAAEPGTINERNSAAQRAERREEYLRAFELHESLIAQLEGEHDEVSWLEATGGVRPSQAYRLAARAAAMVAAGEGYVHVPLARLRWSPEWPLVAALPEGGASPELLASERPRLRDDPSFDSALRTRARERAAAWTVRAAALILRDAVGSRPDLDRRVLRDTVREMLREPCLALLLDQDLSPGLGSVRDILEYVAR